MVGGSFESPERLRPLASVRVRIVAAFLAAVVTILSAVVFLMVQYQAVARSQELITGGYLPLSLIVDQIRGDQRHIETDIERLLREDRRPTTGAQSASSLYGERLRENLMEAQIKARSSLRLAHDPEEIAVLNKTLHHLTRTEELVKTYQGGAMRFVELSEAGRREDAAALAEPVQRDGRSLADEIDKLDMLIDGRIARLTRQVDEQRAQANTVASGLAGVALISSIALLAAVLMALRPIGQLTDHVQRLARGDRPGRLDVRGGDEVALLAREFDRMVEALQLRDRALRERAEQLDRLSRYLASVVDSLEDALIVVEGGKVTLANPAATERWGVVQDGEPPEVVRGWVGAPGVHEHKDGPLEYDVRVVPFGPSGAIVVAADVTEQRRALDRLARSERLALIGQMLAQITHEVRNPLNAMSLNAEMLADEIERVDPDHDTDARDLLGTVSGEIERLTQVTAHYLQLARRPKASLSRESLADVIGEVVRLLRAELDQVGVGLTVRCDEVPPQLVDGNQLRQALLNVVRNAVEAGARRLSLTLHRDDEGVRIALEDDGPGMTIEQVERAFDPFFSTKATGTGLGLAITRQILEDHDGTVEVVTSPGSGATITLRLPDRVAAAVSPSGATPEGVSRRP
jgi:nitrogen-specific signal transduction histidine kinase/HAMP domain-containing protein